VGTKFVARVPHPWEVMFYLAMAETAMPRGVYRGQHAG